GIRSQICRTLQFCSGHCRYPCCWRWGNSGCESGDAILLTRSVLDCWRDGRGTQRFHCADVLVSERHRCDRLEYAIAPDQGVEQPCGHMQQRQREERKSEIDVGIPEQ